MAQIEPGTIYADNGDRLLIAWDALHSGEHLGMPLAPQTTPLHRAHVRLAHAETEALIGQRQILVIDTRIRVVIGPFARMIGKADPALIERITQTYLRARDASNLEHFVSR